jgi:hypothetical protein
MGRSLDALRSGSPLVGIFGALVVMALLLLLAYEFRSPTSEWLREPHVACWFCV